MPAVRPTATPAGPSEVFTPTVKARRDILVDDVERHLGVPVLGQPAPLRTVGEADVAAARFRLAAAIAELDDDPGSPGRSSERSREHLDAVARLLAAVDTAPTTTGNARRLRLARRRLAAAIELLTTVMFAQPE